MNPVSQKLRGQNRDVLWLNKTFVTGLGLKRSNKKSNTKAKVSGLWPMVLVEVNESRPTAIKALRCYSRPCGLSLLVEAGK